MSKFFATPSNVLCEVGTEKEEELMNARLYPLGPTPVLDGYNYFPPDINLVDPQNRMNFCQISEIAACGIWDGRYLTAHMNLAHRTNASFASYEMLEALESDNWNSLIQVCDLDNANGPGINRYHEGEVNCSKRLAYRLCVETRPMFVDLDKLQLHAFKLFLSPGDLHHLNIKSPEIIPFDFDQFPLGDLILLAGYLNMTVDMINDFAAASNGHNPNLIRIAQLLSKEFVQRDGLEELLRDLLLYIPPASSLNFSANPIEDLVGYVKTKLTRNDIKFSDYDRSIRIRWKSRMVLANLLDLVTTRSREQMTKRERKSNPILQIGQSWDRESMATVITNCPISCYRLFMEQ